VEISQIESLCDANQHTESTTEPRVSNFSENYHATGSTHLSNRASPQGRAPQAPT